MDERMNVYSIKEGDILKVGRIVIRIRAIIFKKNNENHVHIENKLRLIQTEKNTIKSKVSKESKEKSCRICYIEEETADNPLLQPCTCSGSMKYIHLNCLKQWLSNRAFKKIESNKNCNVYLYKQAECELCKSKFPDFIKHKGKIYELLDFHNDFKNYIIIESLTLDKNQNKYIYVINSDNPQNRIIIGRGHECNLIINDISISRMHCFLNINKNSKKIFLSDNNSKFGTLVLVHAKNITLSLDLKLYLQIGRSLLEFKVKSPSKSFGCCGVSEKKSSDYYYMQNKDEIKFDKQLTLKVLNDIDLEYEEKYNEEINMKNNENNEIKTNEINNQNQMQDIPLKSIEENKTNENFYEQSISNKKFSINSKNVNNIEEEKNNENLYVP